ncbi:MAG: YrdB family protein [Gaiellaceae bacterium]
MSPPAKGAIGTAQALNLALRLVLEICALAAFGFWGWSQTDAPWRYLLMLGLPALAAGVWGTFAVLNDPSRSGRAPVPVSGATRLGVELAFFGLACWALYDANAKVSGLTLAAAVVVHYALSSERIRWLLAQRSPR